MSKYPNAKERAHELETLNAALALIKIAELELDERPPVLPTKFSHYLIAADAYLLVVPVSLANEHNHRVIEEIMRLSKCDALVVYVAFSGNGPNRVVVDIAIDGLVPVWFREYRPCLLDGVLHFVPDYDASKPTFKLTKKGLTRSLDFDALSSDDGSSAIHQDQPISAGKRMSASIAKSRLVLLAAGLRTFFKLAEEWHLTDAEQLILLGMPAGFELKAMRDGEIASANADTLERISYLLGIYKAIHTLLQDPARARDWLRAPNEAPLFRGTSALDRMLSGEITDLASVRAYLNAQLA